MPTFLNLPVDSTYLTNLIAEMKNCHSSKGMTYIEKIAKGKNTDLLREQLTDLSDWLFYLDNFTVGTDDNKYLHYMKERAMQLCTFTEADLTASLIDNPILLENGGLILTENGLYYIQQESA